MGRADRYSTHVEPYLDDISRWRTTMTEEQIAQKLGIAKSTFQKYKQDYPELNEICKFGNKKKCDEVWSSLFKRAVGYDIPQFKEVIDKDGMVRRLEKPPIHIPADIKAITLILSNLDKAFHMDDSEVLQIKKMLAELNKNSEGSDSDWESLH